MSAVLGQSQSWIRSFYKTLRYGKTVVQVCPGGVTLLSGSTFVQHLSMKDLGVQGRISITSATVADPHLLLHLSDGRALLLTADPAEGMPHHPPAHDDSKQRACWLPRMLLSFRVYRLGLVTSKSDTMAE